MQNILPELLPKEHWEEIPEGILRVTDFVPDVWVDPLVAGRSEALGSEPGPLVPL